MTQSATWTLRLIGAVLDYEDVHEKDAYPCFKEALALVPDDEIAAARVLMEHADAVTELRLRGLRRLGETLKVGDAVDERHGNLILELLDMPVEDLQEHLR